MLVGQHKNTTSFFIKHDRYRLWICFGVPVLQRTDWNQGQIDIICLALNHSPILRASRDETVNEKTAPLMRMTLNEKNSQENLILFHGGLVSLCVPVFTWEPFDPWHPPQIDKVKHEGQILPNIDPLKQSLHAVLTSPQCPLQQEQQCVTETVSHYEHCSINVQSLMLCGTGEL